MKAIFDLPLGSEERWEAMAKNVKNHPENFSGSELALLEVIVTSALKPDTEKGKAIVRQMKTELKKEMGRREGKELKQNLIGSKEIMELLDLKNRQAFWYFKTRKDFPAPAYKAGRAELWKEEDIRKYMENRKEKELKNESKQCRNSKDRRIYSKR